jgi:CRP-like cAMP-binding protein
LHECNEGSLGLKSQTAFSLEKIQLVFSFIVPFNEMKGFAMERKKDYDFFRKMILRIGHVPEDLLEKFYKITSTAVYKKGDLFLRAGELSDLAALNCKGIFRLYYIDQDGNDFTKGFSTEGKFVISYSALVQRRPSFFNIEAVVDSEVFQFSYSKWRDQMEADIRWYPFAFRLVESVYIMKEMREKSFLLDDAKTRYKDFRNHFPNLEGSVKQYHIASFLGITPETLSRIRNDLKYT